MNSQIQDLQSQVIHLTKLMAEVAIYLDTLHQHINFLGGDTDPLPPELHELTIVKRIISNDL